MTIRDSDFPQNTRTPTSIERRPLGTPVFYKDLNINFTPGVNDLVVYNDRAIWHKIFNVLGILVGEEHFEPSWGSDLPLRLFEPVTDRTAYLVYSDSLIAIDRFMETEVSLIYSQSSVTPLDDGEGYNVVLAFEQKKTRVVGTLNFELLRNRRQG